MMRFSKHCDKRQLVIRVALCLATLIIWNLSTPDLVPKRLVNLAEVPLFAYFRSQNCTQGKDVRFTLKTLANNSWATISSVENYSYHIYSVFNDIRLERLTILSVSNYTQTLDYNCLIYDNRTTQFYTTKLHIKLYNVAKQPFKRSYSYMQHCQLPSHMKFPTHVAIVSRQCDSTEIIVMEVQTVATKKLSKTKTFAICGNHLYDKNLNYILFAEFIEYFRQRGAAQMTFYKMGEISTQFTKILNHYKGLGFATVLKMDLIKGLCSPAYTNFATCVLTDHNDCLYRSINQYDYVGFLDWDEIIVSRTKPFVKFLDDIFNQSDTGAVALGRLLGPKFYYDSPMPNNLSIGWVKKNLPLSKTKLIAQQPQRPKMIVKPELITDMQVHAVRQMLKPNLKSLSLPTKSGYCVHIRDMGQLTNHFEQMASNFTYRWDKHTSKKELDKIAHGVLKALKHS